MRIIQSIHTPGFGGLEMVVIEFHEWLLAQSLEAFVFTLEGTPLQRELWRRGHQQTTLAAEPRRMTTFRRLFDSPETALLFHRQQGVRRLGLHPYRSKISLLSHSFSGVRKRDPWHRFLFSRVDQWIALTPSHKQNLIDTTGVPARKVSVIPNGVDSRRFQPRHRSPPEPTATVTIGVIARLDPQKGQDIALHALAALARHKPRRYRLAFLGESTPGEPSIQPSLQRLAESLGIADLVEFRGFQENLHEAIHSLDLIWMPSHQETFGRCLIEGMASGIPIIASAAGGVVDIVQHGQNGLLFETKNPVDLAEKTAELLARPDLQQSLRRQALRDVHALYSQDMNWRRLLNAIAPAAPLLAQKSAPEPLDPKLGVSP